MKIRVTLTEKQLKSQIIFSILKPIPPQFGVYVYTRKGRQRAEVLKLLLSSLSWHTDELKVSQFHIYTWHEAKLRRRHNRLKIKILFRLLCTVFIRRQHEVEETWRMLVRLAFCYQVLAHQTGTLIYEHCFILGIRTSTE